MRPELTEFIPFFFYGGLENPNTFGILLLTSTLIDLILADMLLFGSRWVGRPKVLGIGRVAAVALVLALVFCVKGAIVVFRPRFTLFSLVSIVWYDLLIVGPWCGVRALLRSGHGGRVTLAVKVLAVAFLLFPPVAAWSRFIEPFRLQIEEVRVPRAADETGGVAVEETPRRALRIAVLADIQTDRITDYERDVVVRTLMLSPDVILIPGDLFHGDRSPFLREREAYRALLSRLKPPGGVFFVQGDVDAPEYIEALLEGTGIRWLRDEVVKVEVSGRTVLIAGLLRGLTETATAAVRQLEALPKDGVKLVLCHYGAAVRVLTPGSDVDLVIGGHTHGGQVVIPFFGPPITLSRLPRAAAAGGLHRVDGHSVYVSRGVGLERRYAPRIRFFCPPEVTLLLFE